jgi:hypothetical protein
MSKVTISGNVNGTGTFTIASPNSNTDRTLNLPDASGDVVLNSATQTLTNKTLTTPNIDSAQFATVSGTAPLYACRAWVNFNGTGTVAIRASGNVSSITDNGTGDYTVNFTTAMPDTNYSTLCTCGQVGGGTGNRVNVGTVSQPFTTAVRVLNALGSNTASDDSTYYGVAIFR